MDFMELVFLILVVVLTVIACVKLVIELVYVVTPRFRETTKYKKFFNVADEVIESEYKNKVLKLLVTRSFSLIAIALGVFTVVYVL